MQATSLDEVITHLDTIISACTQQPSRLGYFACLYRKMTIAVKEGIAGNLFADGPRMEKLDVIFASRYLTAYDAFTQNAAATKSWQIAFEAAAKNDYVVLQHLILGINAHINIDLGIAAAEVSAGADINALQNDFEKINDIISALTNGMKKDLANICFPMRFLNDVKEEKVVINFSIGRARKAAWANAVLLSGMDAGQKNAYIETLDLNVSKLALGILNPGFFVNLLLKIARWFESPDIKKNIQFLYD